MNFRYAQKLRRISENNTGQWMSPNPAEIPGFSYLGVAGGAISPWNVVYMSGGKYLAAGANSTGILGAYWGSAAAVLNDTIDVRRGVTPLIAAVPVAQSATLKSYSAGRVGPVCPGVTLVDAHAGGNFGGASPDSAVKVVSNAAGDITQTATIYGVTHGGIAITSETVALSGTDEVTTTKTDWGYILGLSLSAACVGTITLATAGDVVITTIAPASLSSGIIDGDDGYAEGDIAYAAALTAVGGGASVLPVAVTGIDAATGQLASEAILLAGTTAVTFTKKFESILRYYIGGPTTGTTVTFTAVKDTDISYPIGKALATATARGSQFNGQLSV